MTRFFMLMAIMKIGGSRFAGSFFEGIGWIVIALLVVVLWASVS